MIRNEHNFVVHIREIDPAPVTAEHGWKNMDIRFVPGSMSGCDEVCVFRTVFPPGAAHERHYHPHAAEWLYVLSGRAAVGAEEDETEASPGTLQIIPKGKIHWLRNLDRENPVEIVGGYLGVPSLEAAGYEFVGHLTEYEEKVR